MVLAELGSKIQSALAKMGQATVIDEKVLEDLVSHTTTPKPLLPIPLPHSPYPSPSPLPPSPFPLPLSRSRPSRLLSCRPTWTFS